MKDIWYKSPVPGVSPWSELVDRVLDLRIGDSVLGPLSQFPDSPRQNQRQLASEAHRRETGCYFKTATELFFFFTALEAAKADHREGRG